MSNSAVRGESVARLQSIDPYEFEHFVAELWEEEGWDTTVSQASNDLGVDVVAERSGAIDQKAVIQAKRYSDGNKVGRGDVQQYHSIKVQDPEADAAVIATTNEFTKPAEEWGEEHNVKLVDGDDLVDMIDEHGRHDLIEEYASSADSDSARETSPSVSIGETMNNWFTLTGICLFAQAVGLVLLFAPDAVPAIPADVAVWSLFFGWLLSPFFVFFDANWLHSEVGTGPNRLLWPTFAFMIPVLGPFLYVVKRNDGTEV